MAHEEDFGFKLIISIPELLLAIGSNSSEANMEELSDDSTEDSKDE